MKKFFLWALMLLGGAFGALMVLGAIPEIFHGLGGVIGDRGHLAYHAGEMCGALVLLSLGVLLLKRALAVPERLRQLDMRQSPN
jgi:hypothetical protein